MCKRKRGLSEPTGEKKKGPMPLINKKKGSGKRKKHASPMKKSRRQRSQLLREEKRGASPSERVEQTADHIGQKRKGKICGWERLDEDEKDSRPLGDKVKEVRRNVAPRKKRRKGDLFLIGKGDKGVDLQRRNKEHPPGTRKKHRYRLI